MRSTRLRNLVISVMGSVAVSTILWRAFLRLGWFPVGTIGCALAVLWIGAWRAWSLGTAGLERIAIWATTLLGLIVTGLSYIWILGTPGDYLTALFLLGPIVFLIIEWPRSDQRCILALSVLVPVHAILLLTLPVSYRLLDLSNGDIGVIMYPHFVFWRAGPNSVLLRGEFGTSDRAVVFHVNTSANRDVLNYVDSRSLIFDRNLIAVLRMLPSTPWRRRVLASLRDHRNLARVHQGMLLVFLKERGYPDEMGAVDWWSRYGHVFEPQYDAREASQLVSRWVVNIEMSNDNPSAFPPALGRQLDAAIYQENGRGDRGFSKAFHELRDNLPGVFQGSSWLGWPTVDQRPDTMKEASSLDKIEVGAEKGIRTFLLAGEGREAK